MTIIRDAYDWNNVVFDANYLTGSIADKSPYKAAATVTAPVTWTNSKSGYGLLCQGAGRLTYADNVAIRLAGSSATWIMFGNFQKQVALSRVLSKRDGVKIDWEIQQASATTMSLFDWTNVSVMTGSLAGRRLGVITLVSGSKPNLYLDGTFASEGTLTCTIPTNVTPPAFSVSNFYTGAYPCNNVLNRVTILNRALSPAEIAQLYRELTAERYPLRAYSFGQRISAPKDPPGVQALLKTDFTTRLSDGRLADLSGNGWHGTVKPGFAAGPGACGNSLVATSASRTYVDFGDVTPINGASKLTVIWAGATGARSPTELMFDKGSGAGARFDFAVHPTIPTWYVGNKYSTISDANVGTPQCFALRYDGGLDNNNKALIFRDAVPITTTPQADMPAALPNTAGTPLVLGRLSWANSNPPCAKNDFFAIYNAALTPEQVSYVYKQIAGRCTFSLDMQRTCVSLANLTGPCEIHGTPFRVLDGTWKIGEDASGKRWINSVATNNKHVYMPSTQAYGTWTCSVYHTTGDECFAFASNCKDLSLGTRNVYSILLTGTTFSLYRFGPGSSAILMSSTSCIETGKKYKLAITRNSSGQFTVYIKGGAYLDWTKVTATTGTNPVTDTTYTASANCVLSTSPAANGGGFADFAFFAGPLTLDQLQSKV